MTRNAGKRRNASVMVPGVGAFAQSTKQILADAGASVSTHLTSDYGHCPPSLAGPTYHHDQFPSPAPWLKQTRADLVQTP